MRVDELARDEVFAWMTAEVGGTAVAKLSDHLVLFVEQGHDAFQVGNQHFALAESKVARKSHPIGEEADVLAIEGEVLNPSVCPIGNCEHGLMR